MSDPPLAHPIIAAAALGKFYRRGVETIHALEDVTFEIRQGEFIAVVGPSGSGKTTLLNLVGCLDLPSSGRLSVAGQLLQGISEAALTRLRRDKIGFVFQHFALLPTLTVAENIALPTVFSGRPAPQRVNELLDKTGLSHRRTHRPHELSGGEMQRVSVARALINGPSILLADEPTGNLDTATGAGIIELFQQLHADGLTVVVITHNEQLAGVAQRQLVLRDGRLVTDR